MESTLLTVGNCSFELLANGRDCLGLGRIRIGETLVRSGRLPWLPYSQGMLGDETWRFEAGEVRQTAGGLAIPLEVTFRRAPVRQATDYHLERVYDTADWSPERAAGRGRLTLHLEPAADALGGVAFSGFRYRWDYEGDTPLYWLMDRATWELGGDICGATALCQSIVADPCVEFAADTAWTTEELLPPSAVQPGVNPVVTQFWPRWLGHQPFDYQYRPGATLVGLFERLGLIRSALRREPGAAELKVFDRHVFNESTRFSTPAKSILISTASRSACAERNLWSAVLDETNRRALAEAGMREVPAATCLSWNFWQGHTFDSYRKDLLPAAAAIGAESIFIDNVNRSNATEGAGGNQCQSHQYEVAAKLGGPAMLKRLVDDARAAGVRVYSWTSTAQSPDSPLFKQHRNTPGWFVRMEDGRQVFGGTHSTEFQFQNLAHEPARRNWVDGLKRTREETGLDGYFFDMAMNVTFAPVSYEGLHPTTQWREALAAVKELQDAGIELDGLFPPFARPGRMYHAGAASWEHLYLHHRLPFALPDPEPRLWTPEELYRVLAHGSVPVLQLFYGKTRIDELFTDEHRRILREFRDLRPRMRVRRLQDDGAAVGWEDDSGRLALVCSLREHRRAGGERLREFPGGAVRPHGDSEPLRACRTYEIVA